MPDPFFNPDSNNSYTFGFNLDESSFGLHLSDDTDEESFTGTAGTSKEGSTSSKTADQSALVFRWTLMIHIKYNLNGQKLDRQA